MGYTNCSTSMSPNDYWYGALDQPPVIADYVTTITPVPVSTSMTDEEVNKIANALCEMVGKKKEDEVKEENQPSKVTYKGSGGLKADRIRTIPNIEKVIFNPPATVVMWSDGTKTVVKARTGKGRDKFSEEYGLAMAISKKYFGTRNGFLKAIKNTRRPDIPKAIVKKESK